MYLSVTGLAVAFSCSEFVQAEKLALRSSIAGIPIVGIVMGGVVAFGAGLACFFIDSIIMRDWKRLVWFCVLALVIAAAFASFHLQ